MSCNCNCPDANCSCPPDYNIDPLTVECQLGTKCEDAMSSDCVFVDTDMACYGVKSGESLTSVMNKINDRCPLDVNVIANILRIIGSDPTLMSIFCELAEFCASGSSGTVPIIVSITMP